MKKIILNQKSYLLHDEMVEFKKKFDKIDRNELEFVLFPPILYLTMFNNKKYSLGAQNFYSYKPGSFTGELNLESLKDIGITYTIIGHYERRRIIGESKEMTKEKLFKSLNSNFNTLLCIGENKKTKKPFTIIKKDINYYLKSIEKNNLKHLSIIYEPNCAIGSGKIVKMDVLAKTISRIKSYIKSKYGVVVEVYYGGQLPSGNIKRIFDMCDGIVLGKQSIFISEINNIIREID